MFPHPHEILDKCKEMLVEKGTLIIQVPRSDSFLAKVFTKDCQLFTVPFHLFMYSEGNLRTILNNHGLRTKHVRQIIAPDSLVESVSLTFYGRKGQITESLRLLIVTVGLIFELVAMFFGRTGIFEV